MDPRVITGDKLYTLLYILENTKIVHIKTFLTLEGLKDYKHYYLPELKNSKLHPVDKDGYVWFCEVEDEVEG